MFKQSKNVNLSELKIDSNVVAMTNDANGVDEQQDRTDKSLSRSWKLPVSELAKHTVNPIRQISESLFLTSTPKKPLIKLNLGDPTVSGALTSYPVAHKAVIEALKSGILEAREAVARHFTHPEAPITAESVVLTSGCSHALMMAIEALANPGDNILLPAPGFSLYRTLIVPLNIEERYYHIDISNGAKFNLAQIKSLIDDRTRAIIINNPPNPYSVVLDKEQLESLLRIAYDAKIPIIADEVYGTMTYNGATFHPLATLEPKVPILTCDGISKRYLLPGWRLGWIIIHDRYQAFQDIRDGLTALAQKIIGPCTLIQGALPQILESNDESFFHKTNSMLQKNAKIVFNHLNEVPGLRPLMPNGAMYMIIKIDKQMYGTDEAFVNNLLEEENVSCLPAKVFHDNGWFRIVLTHHEEDIREACNRIIQFCSRRHLKFLNEKVIY